MDGFGIKWSSVWVRQGKTASRPISWGMGYLRGVRFFEGFGIILASKINKCIMIYLMCLLIGFLSRFCWFGMLFSSIFESFLNDMFETSISRTFSVAFRRALCRHTSRTHRFFAAWPRLSWNPSFFNNFCNDVSWRIQSIVMVFHAQHLPLWLRASIGNHYFCDNFVFFDDIFREANYQTNPSILWRFFNDLRHALISPCPDYSDFLMKK